MSRQDSTPPRPARWAVRLLTMLLPPGLPRDAVLGDLEEEFADRASTGQVVEARRRYARRALGVAFRYAVFRLTSALEPRWEGRAMLRSILHDFGQSVRSLARVPNFTLLVVLTLGAGVGSTTAIFSVIDGVLLRPLPYPDSDQLVLLRFGRDGREIDNQSEPEFHDYERAITSFSSVAAHTVTSVTLGSATEPERITAVRATASIFPLLGVPPYLGRAFGPDEDAPDAARVAVLSHALWVRSYGSDPGVIGRTVILEDIPHTVVGVMPAGFSFPQAGVQAWLPLRLNLVEPWTRNNHYLSVVARLAPEVGLDAARAELEALGASSTQAHPDYYPTPARFVAYRLRDSVVGEVRAPLLLLFGAVAGVLLIASVNTAALFLARGEHRRSEIAVRTVLGAGRLRVAGQLLGESLLVAGAAAIAGSALAYGGVAALRRIAPPNLPRLEEVSVDARVLAFGLLVSVLTGLLFGLAPMLQAFRSDVRGVLAAGAWGGIGSPGAGRFRRGLVVAQLSLATMLALWAGLLMKSFEALRRVDLGFDPHGVLTVPLSPPMSAVPPDAAAIEFYRALEARIAAIPGVAAVGSAYRLPLAEGHDDYSIQVEGRLAATIGDAPSAGMQWATPGFFAALGIPVRQGRLFTDADRAEAPPVAVVNERLAGELWPGENPIGKRVRMFMEESPWMEIVGVVADVKHYGIQAEASTKLYIPHLQGHRSGYWSPNRMTVFVRTDGDPSRLAGSVRAVVRELGPGVPIGSMRTMDEVTAAALGRERFTLLLLGAFAGVALLLAAVGVYGVVARGVAARTREFGLRMAVGADRAAIAGAVLREGLALAALGCALGSAGGLALAGAVRTLLFGVSPTDPRTYAAAVPLLALVVLLACAAPALRASRLDPVKALRDG